MLTFFVSSLSDDMPFFLLWAEKSRLRAQTSSIATWHLLQQSRFCMASPEAPPEGEKTAPVSDDDLKAYFKYNYKPPPLAPANNPLLEACAPKFIMSAIGGGVMGVGFGFLFGGQDPMIGNTQTTVMQYYRMAGKNAVRMGKQFAVVGAVFSSADCLTAKVSPLLTLSIAGARTRGTASTEAASLVLLWLLAPALQPWVSAVQDSLLSQVA